MYWNFSAYFGCLSFVFFAKAEKNKLFNPSNPSIKPEFKKRYSNQSSNRFRSATKRIFPTSTDKNHSGRIGWRFSGRRNGRNVAEVFD